MKPIVVFLLGLLIGYGGVCAETFNTPVLDGVIGDDWGTGSAFETQTLDGCTYTLHVTWDAEFLWIGLESDTCRRFLGDNEGDISFFVAIDVDQVYGLGSFDDGYGNVKFYGCYRPEYIFFYAGGAGWYEWAYAVESSFTWLGWRNDNTYYAWDGGGVYDDELGILWSDIGNPPGVAVMAWINDENCTGGCGIRPWCAGVLVGWPPQNSPANCGLFWWAYPFFAPHVPGPMPVEGFDPDNVTPTNGEFSATSPSSWGAVKALYK
jgi:hypothetical protein